MSNLDDFSDKEKIIKYSFKFLVQAYLINQSEVVKFRTSSNTRLNVNITERSIPVKKKL